MNTNLETIARNVLSIPPIITMKAATCIENYINGNLSDAKEQARRISNRALFDAAIDYGMSRSEAIAVAHYLKHPSQQSYDLAVSCTFAMRQRLSNRQ